jgi:hypothetical protein
VKDSGFPLRIVGGLANVYGRADAGQDGFEAKKRRGGGEPVKIFLSSTFAVLSSLAISSARISLLLLYEARANLLACCSP